MSNQFDVVVIGAGPGGYVAAIRAAQLGMKTAIVERDRLGGVCLNWGCIPTKALLRTAELYRLMRHAADFGLKAEAVSFDPTAVVARSRKVAERLSGGVAFLMKKHKITVISGEAKLATSPAGPLVQVQGKEGAATLSAKHIIIATGARPRAAPGLVPDGQRIWTYKEAMTPPQWPSSLLVLGSGAIGVEFASFYSAFGVPVTVLELVDRILPVEDAEIAAFARKRFERHGMTILTGARTTALSAGPEGVSAQIEVAGAARNLQASHAILAIGIVGNTEGLGLEAIGVTVERGHIKTDGYGRTGVSGVYAIGDVTGAPWLAHKASHEAVICVEAIAGQHPHVMNTAQIPGCTYSDPQIASVGLTEAAAKASGREIRVGRFPFSGNGKAIALGEDQGLVKTVFDAKTGELLGAHMVGADVTELIQGYAVAMSGELTEAELMDTVFPHPTLSEMMHEAVLDAYGRALHV
jgi:dihydrolipoamide dehydrogenase